MGKNIDEKSDRLQRHLKRLESNHAEEFDERFGEETNRKKLQKEALNDAMSAHWNAQKKGDEGASPELLSPEETRARHDAVVAQQAADRQRQAVGVSQGPKFGEVLPEDWRNEHWKTLQVLAAEYPGIETKNKAESVAALEAYEARLTAQAA